MFTLQQTIHYKQPTPSLAMLRNFHQQTNQKKPPSNNYYTTSNAFGGLMIDRIQHIRSGCGSCGH